MDVFDTVSRYQRVRVAFKIQNQPLLIFDQKVDIGPFAVERNDVKEGSSFFYYYFSFQPILI